MTDIDERVDALLKSPVGCAFLLLANSTGLAPKELAEPDVSLYIGARVTSEVNVWIGNYQRLSQQVLRRGAEHSALAKAILQEPAAAWWFASLYLENQIYVPRNGAPPDSARMVTPKGPPSWHERYGQQVFGGFFTSTLVHGLTSLFATIDRGNRDIGAGYPDPPFACWRLKVAESARVLEINGPQEWHSFCLSYPAEKAADSNHPDFSGDAGQLVPDWSIVAVDWDAVHLTFGGLLTAEHVRIQSPEGWTYLWAWDAEVTLWLRWVFTSSERLPDYTPMQPASLLNMSALHFLL